MPLLKILGTLLGLAAMVSYALMARSVWRLVNESRRANPGVRFHRLAWIPAWRMHRRAFPVSELRRKIRRQYVLTAVLLVSGMACLVVSLLRGGAPAR